MLLFSREFAQESGPDAGDLLLFQKEIKRGNVSNTTAGVITFALHFSYTDSIGTTT